MDMSIPIILGTIVAEVGVVISSFIFSNFLNRRDQVKLNPKSRATVGAYGCEDATHNKLPPKTISYKDERESYFDHSATATHMKFDRDTDHE